LGLAADGRAGEVVNHLSQVRQLVDALVGVVARVEPRERRGAQAYLDRFLDDWIDRASQADRDHKLLYYRSSGKGQINLIKPFTARGNAWPTLGSMRNVDMESLVEVAHGGASAGQRP
jgi:hypothetical protein